MPKSLKLRFTPPQVLVFGFAAAILLGSILLTLPVTWAPGKSLNYLDALFTATSAVCVTGLVVVDTGTSFSLLGKVIIAILIQIGGLGVMTMGTLVALILGRKIGLRERILMQEALNQVSLAGLVRITRYILLFSFGSEAVAALILGSRLAQDMGWRKGMAFGVFHSVSAFNNAGFDLFGEYRSITGYNEDLTVNLIIGTLIIVGGLGFGVIFDVLKARGRWHKFDLHTKLALLVSAFLLVLGAVIFFLLERSNPDTLQGLSVKGKLLASAFQSITPRTAGFNTVNIGGLRPATLLWIMILMFIGASPGSTGGGIKTTTFGTLAVAIWAMISGKEDAQAFERRLPKEQVYKALTITLIGFFLITLVTMLLAVTEKFPLDRILFEVISAFGTVGLSTGITPDLTYPGRALIIITMFAGRVGPLTLAYALAARRRKAGARYPEERIIVG